MAADSMFGQKCSEEVKEGLTEFMASHAYSGKEFMAHVLELLELERVAKGSPDVNRDLVELNIVTARMIGIFRNLVERNETLESAKTQEYKALIQEKEEMIHTMKQFVDEKTDEVFTLKESLEKSVNEQSGLEYRVNELTANEERVRAELKEANGRLMDVSDTKQALIEEYKEKNDLLLGKLKGAEEAMQERTSLLAKIKELEAEKVQLEIAVKTKDEAVKVKSTEYAMALEKLKSDNAETIEHSKNVQAVEVEKQILTLQKEHQEEVKALNLEIKKAGSESNKKVEDLLAHIEALQKEQKDSKEIVTKEKKSPKAKISEIETVQK